MRETTNRADTARIEVLVTSHGGPGILIRTADTPVTDLPRLMQDFERARYLGLNGKSAASPVGQSVHGADRVQVVFNSDSPEGVATFEKRRALLDTFLIAALDNRLPGQQREPGVYHGGIQPSAYAAALLLPQADADYAAGLDTLLEQSKPGDATFAKAYAKTTERPAILAHLYQTLRPLLVMAAAGQTEADILRRVARDADIEKIQKSYNPAALRDPTQSLFDLDRKSKLTAALGIEIKKVDSGNRMPVRCIYG